MSQETQEPLASHGAFSETEIAAEYRPVSPCAVISLVLAIAGVGAVFSTLMICVALAAAALAVVALWSIGRADRPPLGRKAALVALLLSLFCGAWGVTWRTVRQQVVCNEARQLADKWLQLVQAGRLQEAHQLHLPRQSRQAPGMNLADFYKNTREARFEMDGFFREYPLDQIVAAGQRGRLRFLECESLQNESYAGSTTDAATLRYALDYERDGQPQTVTFLVFIGRTIEPGKAEANWELRSVQLPKRNR